jgi:hypothetical protein
MKDFREISIHIVIALLLILIIVFAFANGQEKELGEYERRLPSEFAYYCELEKRRKFTTEALAKSCISGFIRGALIGAIVNGYSGAAVGGTVFAVMNPVIIAIEQYL